MIDIDLSDMEDDEDDEFEEVSFQEIFGEALADGSSKISIETTEIPRVKRGIINAKQSARKRANRKGIPWDRVTLVFEETLDQENNGFTTLKVTATRKAVIRVRKLSAVNLEEL